MGVPVTDTMCPECAGRVCYQLRHEEGVYEVHYFCENEFEPNDGFEQCDWHTTMIDRIRWDDVDRSEYHAKKKAEKLTRQYWGETHC